MQKALLVTEKFSVANDIRKIIGKHKGEIPYDITVASAAGHLVGLIEPDEYRAEWGTPWKKEVLPIIPERWQTKVINEKVFADIKREWDKGIYDVVINCGDAGREGQVIQELIYDKLGVDVPILRVWASDTTENTILRELKDLKSNDEFAPLKDAAYLRLYFDWLVGMNFSRAASLALDRNVQIGRVMTCVLAMIVNREKEIKNFTPVKYYEGVVNAGEYVAKLLNSNPPKDLGSFAFEKADIEGVKPGSDGTVMKAEYNEKDTTAPLLFNLTDLQKFCSEKYKFTPAKTLSLAQSLYEKHYLSYPRTESRYLGESQIGEITGVISSIQKNGQLTTEVPLIGGLKPNRISEVLKSKKYVNSKKVSDHPALVPTYVIPDLTSLSEGERLVYLAVLKRFIAIFLPPCKTVSAKVLIADENRNAYGISEVYTIDAGHKAIWDKTAEGETKNRLKAGDKVVLSDFTINEKTTTAPPHYTGSTILSAMEHAGRQVENEELRKALNEASGIGTAATRAEILEKLENCYYITVNKTEISPTKEGCELIDAISQFDITKPDFTAMWEDKLREVESGTLSFDKFYSVMIEYIKETTEKFFGLKAIGPYKEVLGVCPKCKTNNFVGIYGFYACEGYLNRENPTCDFALPRKFGTAILTSKDAKNLISGKTTEKKHFVSKDGKEADSKLMLSPDFRIGFAKDVIGVCPCCGNSVIEGEKGYYCEMSTERNGHSCNFVLYKKFGETTITRSQMEQILSNGATKKAVKITYKSGKSFTDNVTTEHTEDGKYRFAFVKFETKELCNCPYCDGGKVLETRNMYECSNRGKTCDFAVYKKYCKTDISSKDICEILMGQNGVKKKIHFNNGTSPVVRLGIRKCDKTKYNYYCVNKGKKG